MTFRLKSLSEHVAATAEPDAELLARFVRDRNEAAFTALVERYGPMVIGACRRVLGVRSDAEDAFQATFLVLARKAHTCPAPLAGWLYGVARRVALKARSKQPDSLTLDIRDRGRDPLAELSAREVLTILDDEIQRLPAGYRMPVVLCCLEGLTLEEAAARLGCSKGALRGRLERGRDRLRAGLCKRGIVPALALAAVPRIATASAPFPGLSTRTTRAAVMFVSRTGPVPAGPRLLAEGVIRTMLATKLKLVVAALTAALAIPALLSAAIGITPLVDEKAAGPQKEKGAPTPPTPAAADKPKADAKDQDALQGLWQAVELEHQGQKAPDAVVKRFQVRIKGDKLVFGPGTDDREHTFSLDPGVKPKAMDLVPSDGPAKGKRLPCAIYRLDGDTLTICLDKDGEANKRPIAFKTAAEDGFSLLTLKRVVPPK